LSAALNSLGIATSEINCFERAILANNDALTVYTRDDHPPHWANCRWGIGTALKLTAEEHKTLLRHWQPSKSCQRFMIF
jgi:hypothetical protein